MVCIMTAVVTVEIGSFCSVFRVLMFRQFSYFGPLLGTKWSILRQEASADVSCGAVNMVPTLLNPSPYIVIWLKFLDVHVRFEFSHFGGCCWPQTKGCMKTWGYWNNPRTNVMGCTRPKSIVINTANWRRCQQMCWGWHKWIRGNISVS